MLKSGVKLVVIVSISLMLTSFLKKKNSFEARIDGWGNDTIMMYYSLDGDVGGEGTQVNTLVAKDGFISYNLTTQDTIIVTFINPNSSPLSYSSFEARTITTMIYPGSKESIKGTLLSDRLEYISKGDKIFRESSKFRSELLPHYVALDTLDHNFYKLQQKRKATSEESDNWESKAFELLDTICSVKSTFVKENPDNDASAKYALRIVDYCRDIEYINTLSERVRSGVYKKILIAKHLDITNKNLARKNSSIIINSVPAPNFTLTSIDGSLITLSDYKGKWVVLDFWGSWCLPCIQDIPDLKVSYNKHKDKVVVIGVACNDSDKAWRRAVEANKIPWINVIDTKNTEESAVVKYGVTRFPTKIIITPDQTVAKRVMGKGSSFNSDLDTLLK